MIGKALGDARMDDVGRVVAPVLIRSKVEMGMFACDPETLGSGGLGRVA